MKMSDAFSAKAIAIAHKEVASNKIAYLGEGLFPTKKKMGLDLKWIKTSKGLPVSLAPSAFDTKSTIRSREGIEISETEMAYFKESMLVKEQDEQEILRVVDSADPYAQDVIAHIYSDAETLVDGAKVVPERMIMQLLSPASATAQISISANGATYAYNYGTINFKANSGTSAWTDTANSDPLKDVEDAQDAIEASTGNRPTRMIINSATMGYLKKNEKLKAYVLAQNPTANVMMNDARIKELFLTELGVTVIVYNKQYKNEAGVASKFFPDGYATLIPEGTLGNTWFGTTPEERTLMARPDADVSVVDGGIAVAVTISDDPVQTKTTVSEIVLPSFEGMDDVYVIKAY